VHLFNTYLLNVAEPVYYIHLLLCYRVDGKNNYSKTGYRVMNEGDTLHAYCPIFTLHTAYRHFLALRAAYRLTIKTTIFGVSI